MVKETEKYTLCALKKKCGEGFMLVKTNGSLAQAEMSYFIVCILSARCDAQIMGSP